MISYSLEDLSKHISATIIGESSENFTGLNHLKCATKNQISFIGSSKYTKLYAESNAGAVVINESLKHLVSGEIPLLVVPNADLAMAKLLSHYEPKSPVFEEAISKNAYIHPTAIIGENCRIGPGC